MRAQPYLLTPAKYLWRAAGSLRMGDGGIQRHGGRPGRDAAPDVDVGPSLAARMRGSAAHAKFVGAVLQACRSPRAARLGIARYAIDEEYDAESPRWTTIALTDGSPAGILTQDWARGRSCAA